VVLANFSLVPGLREYCLSLLSMMLRFCFVFVFYRLHWPAEESSFCFKLAECFFKQPEIDVQSILNAISASTDITKRFSFLILVCFIVLIFFQNLNLPCTLEINPLGYDVLLF
jgi:hypothetical protein